jgi:ubiquilin
MSTGQGASSPFGVGGYGMVNHPQYMSAISSAVDPDKMEEMLDDPQTQGMLEQMLDDPDTLRQLMEENPMLRSMMKDNPQMKMMFENPALMKMLMSKHSDS